MVYMFYNDDVNKHIHDFRGMHAKLAHSWCSNSYSAYFAVTCECSYLSLSACLQVEPIQC